MVLKINIRDTNGRKGVESTRNDKEREIIFIIHLIANSDKLARFGIRTVGIPRTISGSKTYPIEGGFSCMLTEFVYNFVRHRYRLHTDPTADRILTDDHSQQPENTR